MVQFIRMFFDFLYNLFRKIGAVTIVDFNGQSFNFSYLIFACFVVSLCVNLFWKGGKG